MWTPDDPFDYVEKYVEKYNNPDCCNLHYLPTDETTCCECHAEDTGPGILLKGCGNCWYFNDRMKKYYKKELIK
jgi:hypothetical protein